MKQIPYWQKLKDPRWQRKRLEIMERDNFSCCSCGDKTSTLNVHHSLYEKGKEPWEYDGDKLKTLCENCHECIEINLIHVRRFLFSLTNEELDIFRSDICYFCFAFGVDSASKVLREEMKKKWKFNNQE